MELETVFLVQHAAAFVVDKLGEIVVLFSVGLDEFHRPFDI